MAKTQEEFNLDGKSLLITAKVEGFRRGGIAHPACETLHNADEFSPEQVIQIMAENGKNLVVKIVKIKGLNQPDAEELAKVVAAIEELQAEKQAVNVTNLTKKCGFEVKGLLKEQALAALALKAPK